MKRILIIGKTGQVGWELQRTLAPLGQIIALGRKQLDMTQGTELKKILRECRPDVIVNAAAYTAVDRAQSESQLAMAINGEAPGIIAEEAKLLNALLIHYSTDYVFDGSKSAPYTENDSPNPLNVYGNTKLAGEMAIRDVGCHSLILRTSWVYGVRGANFLHTMLRLAKEKPQLRIVDDQIGAPTWSRLIAVATAQIIQKYWFFECAYSGIYHLTSQGQTTWFDFAAAIFAHLKQQPAWIKDRVFPELLPIPSTQYPCPAARPPYSVLCNLKVQEQFNVYMPHWKDALDLCLDEMY